MAPIEVETVLKTPDAAIETPVKAAATTPAVANDEGNVAATVTEVPASKAFSKESEQLVKQSWAVLRKNSAHNGVIFFMTIFEIAPEAKALFPFLKDTSVPMEKNPKVKAHAYNVFNMTGNAAVELGEKGAFASMDSPELRKLAATHVRSGVQDAHFKVVKEALLQTIAKGVPDMWCPELKVAWGEAYDALATAIKNEMRVAAAMKK